MSGAEGTSSSAEGPGSLVTTSLSGPAPSASARPASPLPCRLTPSSAPRAPPQTLTFCRQGCARSLEPAALVCVPQEALSCSGFGSETRSGVQKPAEGEEWGARGRGSCRLEGHRGRDQVVQVRPGRPAPCPSGTLPAGITKDAGPQAFLLPDQPLPLLPTARWGGCEGPALGAQPALRPCPQAPPHPPSPRGWQRGALTRGRGTVQP